MRYGPGQHGGKPFRLKPFHVKPTPVHRSPALATREGGIIHLLHEPREAGIGREPRAAARQRAIANRLVSEYERGPRVGNLGHALERVGSAYVNNPVSRNPIVGRKGLLGGLEDLMKTADPIALEQSLAKTVRHPLASRSATGLNAGVVVPGFGEGGLRGLKVSKELTPEGRLVGSLPEARKAYKEQQPLQSSERAQRFGKARVAGEQAGHGEAGYYAELGQLKGKLPTVSFDALREGHVPQEHFDQLMTRIATHPALQQGEKLSGRRALIEARDFGKPPPPHAQLIWQKAFGDARAKALTPRDQHWIFDLATLPRSIMSTADLSGILRQGLVAAHQEPVLAAKAARAQLSFFRSKGAFERSQHEITQRPNFERMQTGKLALTDIGGDLAQREEAFMSQITQHVPIMAGSSRAYIGGLNKLRADIFDKQIARAKGNGRDINDPKLLQAIAKQINSATGRGDYGARGNRYAPAGNLLFFSPRLIKSRLDYLNPHWYYKLDPHARSQAIKGVSRLAGTMAAILYAAHLAGAKLQGDPRSSDFAKIRFGNTRFDPLGGFQQYIRAGSQIATGKAISTTTGKTMTLGSGFGQPTRLTIAGRFAQSKAAPVPSFILDALAQHDFTGKSFNLSQEAYSRMIPLLWQDVYSYYKDTGSAGLAALVYGIGGVGVGVQNYGPKKTKPKRFGGGSRGGSSNPLLGGGGGANPLLPGGGGSSNPYLP